MHYLFDHKYKISINVMQIATKIKLSYKRKQPIKMYKKDSHAH